MDLVVYDDDEHRYVPWTVGIAALLVVMLLTAVITFLLTRETSAETVQGVTSPEAALAPAAPSPSDPVPSPSASTPLALPPSALPSAPPPGTASPGTAPAGPDGTSAACAEALRQADVTIASSTRVGQALSEHTRIMDELLAERLTAVQALDQTLPVLTSGAKERDSLAVLLAAYESARRECPA